MLLLKDSANDLILLKRTQPDMYEGQKMTGNLKEKQVYKKLNTN